LGSGKSTKIEILTQINTTAARKIISKLYQGSRSALDYFRINQVHKVLIKHTQKDYITDLAIPPKIIIEVIGAAAYFHIQREAVNLISDAKQGTP
jgi:hypothetical protein